MREQSYQIRSDHSRHCVTIATYSHICT